MDSDLYDELDESSFEYDSDSIDRIRLAIVGIVTALLAATLAVALASSADPSVSAMAGAVAVGGAVICVLIAQSFIR